MHFARIFKFTFIFIAIGLTVFLLTQNNEQVERVDISVIEPVDNQLKKTRVSDVASTTMLSPRFSGEDNKNRKWLITANKATQSGTVGEEKVILDIVQANATTSNGKKLSFIANEGNYIRSTNTLSLQKGIEITGYGFIIKTKEIIASLEDGVVTGNNEVTVTTDLGQLVAKNFNIQGNGEKIVFAGGVNGQFNLKDKN